MENSLFEDKSVEEIRIIMSQHGWISEDRITNLGWGDADKYGYSIWFKRWDWHGANAADVCFHEHTPDLSKIREKVEICALKSLKAWEDFPNSIPHQTINGIKEDVMKTKILNNYKSFYNK